MLVGAASLGAMMRDSSGKVLGALAQNIILPSSTAAVEVSACCKAMLFAKEQGFEDFIFEGDANVIIKAIMSLESSHLEYGHVISDVLALVGDFFFCNFSHVKHLENSVAHFLARSSKSGCELQVWHSCVADDIAPLVTHDPVIFLLFQ